MIRSREGISPSDPAALREQWQWLEQGQGIRFVFPEPGGRRELVYPEPAAPFEYFFQRAELLPGRFSFSADVRAVSVRQELFQLPVPELRGKVRCRWP